MLKRIGLFLLTNIAVLAVITIILNIFDIRPYLTREGLDYGSLLAYAAVVGFAGSFVSLFMSKWMAKMAFGVEILTTPRNDDEQWLLNTVSELASKAGLGMPSVGIYDSPEPNAFATGWNRNNALVAVSTGLLQAMDKEEVTGVLGHEISHVRNGDMVTLALIQGVVNTFVIFFARIAAYLVMQFFQRGEGEERGNMSELAYMGVSLVFQILFGILASLIVMWFSRQREFRADAGSAHLLGKNSMIKALQRLKEMQDAPEDQRAPAFEAFKIRGHTKIFAWFASHPPIEARIAALQNSP